MTLDNAVRHPEDVADVAREIAFATKELRLARDLSERLGDTTVRSPSRSRPSGLSRGHRSVSESDQRRPLLLAQELMLLPPDDLIVLKAGLRPVRARKLRYYRDPDFRRRPRPAPEVARCAEVAVADEDPGPEPLSPEGQPGAPLTLEAIAPQLAAGGFDPLPEDGASPAEIEAWVTRFIDDANAPAGKEPRHG